MRRFKGSKKVLRGLEVALIKNLVFIHNILETVIIIHPISIAWKRKGHKIWFKGAKKEFRFSKVAYK